MSNNILITGASGQLGRRVLDHLIDGNTVDPSRIIATTRKPEALTAYAERGITVRHVDFDDEPSLEKAFVGADKILIIATDLFDLVDNKRLRQHERAIRAAKALGASHLAYTSMIHPEPGSPIPFANDHYGTEEAIKASGLSYTIYQNNAYYENLVLALPTVIKSGFWFTSAGEGRTAYASRDDMAAAIARNLSSDLKRSETLQLTGSIAYTNAEVAELATRVLGKPIELVDLSDEALTEQLKAFGVPEPFAILAAAVDANARLGLADSLNDTIESLIQRPPLSLEDFLVANRAVFLQ
ncbi:NADPH:quinone oxidoreductase 2 [Acidisarcina polymorpha]|uniref:NADPH:quinone oxidoreductase 2 n=1 Tax=Acidisarcina polymorpha TaxID=2211140 RepID=A0A2Z5G0J8_9BACT|nr:SDR family oxidoreductase [Acidisarcina polymorpha]AXC12155.1 NADPH:quinone oxidoreductase 2 [Acidisarcina polymorpha]